MSAKLAAVGFIIGVIFILFTHHVFHKEIAKKWPLTAEDLANEKWLVEQIKLSSYNDYYGYKDKEFMKPKRFPKSLPELEEVVEEGIHDWKDYKRRHAKRYTTLEEERQRMLSFINADRYVDLHNEAYEKGDKTFKVGINDMADFTSDEYQKLNGYINNSSTRVRRHIPKNYVWDDVYVSPLSEYIPDSIDWRQHGCVTEVKNQGQCGSCWAFSAIGAVEGHYKRKYGKLIAFSEQHLVDCSRNGNQGCNGGNADVAFQFIMDNGGIATEESYPYEGKRDVCPAPTFYEKKAAFKKYIDIPRGDEKALKRAVALKGPVSVSIDVDHMSFMYYKEGFYYEPMCSSYKLDHAVLVVGYGSDRKHGDYWIVKNSWGTSWGMNGYIHMARNRGNNCGIATDATYPVF